MQVDSRGRQWSPVLCVMKFPESQHKGTVSNASAVWRSDETLRRPPGDMLELNLRAGIPVQLVLI